MTKQPRTVRPLFAALIVGALIAAACSSSGDAGPLEAPDTSADDSGSITIAVEGPRTGDQIATGIDMSNAAALAVSEANANGGVAGKQVTLMRLDDAADAATGVAVATKAVSDGIFAVVGPYNSSVGIENLPIYIEGGVIPIHLTSNEATDGMGFTVQPKDYQVAPVEADAIAHWLKAKTVSIVWDTSTYTAGIAKQVTAELKEAGVKIVFTRQFRTDNVVPGLLARQLKEADADLFYASTYFPEGGRIAKAAYKAGVPSQCFMGLANQDNAFVASAGLDAARACYVSGVPSPDQFPGAETYAADYREEFGTEPGTWGTFTYDSVNLLFGAVESAGSWDAAAVEEELAGTQDFAGTTGAITIDPKTGNRTIVPVVVLDVNKDGQFVVDRSWAKFAGFEL